MISLQLTMKRVEGRNELMQTEGVKRMIRYRRKKYINLKKKPNGKKSLRMVGRSP